MAHQINEEGYLLMVTGQVAQGMAAQYGGRVVGVMQRLNAPKGFEPGSTDDSSKGYGLGSEILTKDGNLFKCIDNTNRRARWIQVQTEVTESSFDLESFEAEQAKVKKALEAEKAAEVKKAEELEPENVTEIPEPEAVEDGFTPQESNGAAAPEKSLKDGEFQEMPYLSFIEKNGIETLSELRELIDRKELIDLKYMNADRVQRIIAFLKENGYS